MKEDKEEEIARLTRALVNSGWTANEIASLASEDHLVPIRQLVNGRARVDYLEHAIDLDAHPYVPDGWQLVSYRKGGLFKVSSDKVTLCWVEGQLEERQNVKGELLLELYSRNRIPIFNSSLLDYLLVNQNLIPEKWKKDERGWPLYILFLGSIFIDKEGRHVVRILMWNDLAQKWCGAKLLLSGGFGLENPAVILG